MNAKHRELLRKNYVVIVESLRVEDIRSHMIQDGILTISHFQTIAAKPTRKERAEEFLDILVTRGPNAFKVFLRALRHDYSFLYNTLMGKGTERELDLIEESKVLKDENKSLKQHLHKMYRVFEGLLSKPCTVASLMSAIHREKEKLRRLLFPAKTTGSPAKGQKTISSKIVSSQKQQTTKKAEPASRINTAKVTTKLSAEEEAVRPNTEEALLEVQQHSNSGDSSKGGKTASAEKTLITKQSAEETVRPKSDGDLRVQQHNNNNRDSLKGSKSASAVKTMTAKVATAKPQATKNDTKSRAPTCTSGRERTEPKSNLQVKTAAKANARASSLQSSMEQEREAPTTTLSYSLLSETTKPKHINDNSEDHLDSRARNVGQHTTESDNVGDSTSYNAAQKETDATLTLRTALREKSEVEMRQPRTEGGVQAKTARAFPDTKSKKQETVQEDMLQKSRQGMTTMDKQGQQLSEKSDIKTASTHQCIGKHDNNVPSSFGQVRVSGTSGINKTSSTQLQQTVKTTSLEDKNQTVSKATYSPGKVTISGSAGSSTKPTDTTRRLNTAPALQRTVQNELQVLQRATVVSNVPMDKPEPNLLTRRPKQTPPTLRNVRDTGTQMQLADRKQQQTTQQPSKRRGSVIKIRFEEGRLSRVDIREDNDDTDSGSGSGSITK